MASARMGNFVSSDKLVIFYGIALAGIMLLLKGLQIWFIITNRSFEVYIGAIAIIFINLGIVPICLKN